MIDKTELFDVAPVDPEELKKLELENIRKLISGPIEADTLEDFTSKVGERQFFREKYFPETLNSPAPETPKKPIKYQQLSELAPDLRGPDSNPFGTKTIHKSADMADDMAIRATKFPKLSGSISSAMDVVDVPVSNAAAPTVGKGIGKAIGKAALGAGTGFLSEIAFPNELGPDKMSDDAIIEDPRMPLELRKAAMLRAKNKYLKSQD